jgi:DNA polymerase III subunit delta
MPKPVYALVGSDTFLQLERLAALARELPADAQRSDFDGETAQLADVLDELRSFAMFGGDKLVVVRDADAFLTRFREQLEDYVAAPSSSATLVLRLTSLPANQRIHKAIAKVGEVVNCAPPKDLARWLADRGKAAHKIALNPDAARALVDLIGDDLGRLDNELAKLALQCDDKGGRVDADAVTCNVAFQREREMWDLTNALAAGQPDEALRRWRQLLQLDPSTEFRAVTWLSLWLKDVGIVLGNDPAAFGKLRWKYKEAFDTFVRSTRALGQEGFGRAVDLLAEVDRQSKSGVGDAAENVERFILTLAAER